MRSTIDTLVLIALPASGKSEVRKYMLNSSRESRLSDFHIGDTVQLDDYPYVEFLHDVDDALTALGETGRFYQGPTDPFLDGRDWGTLLKLVNQDYAVLKNPHLPLPSKDPQALFDRVDAARVAMGAPAVFATMSASLRTALRERLAVQAAGVVDKQFKERPADIHNYTIVIEFARGGPDGADMPLQPPHGYAWNLAQLSAEVLANATVLYVWVSPEESRHKNRNRGGGPGEKDTGIFHMCPESVMLASYGCDDIAWMRANTEVPDTLTVSAHGRAWHLPVAVFDNRVDKTTFTRADRKDWKAEDITALHNGLAGGFANLWRAHVALKR